LEPGASQDDFDSQFLDMRRCVGILVYPLARSTDVIYDRHEIELRLHRNESETIRRSDEMRDFGCPEKSLAGYTTDPRAVPAKPVLFDEGCFRAEEGRHSRCG
jgi:hypothetical protein